MTTGSGLDKPPPCDSNKDGGSLIGDRLQASAETLSHFPFRLQVTRTASVRDVRAKRKPHVSCNANPALAVKPSA